MEIQKSYCSADQEAARRNHRRQAFWQIWFPIAMGGIIFVGLTVFLIVTTSAGQPAAEHWANISAIWLLLPSILVSVIWLALLGGMIFLLAKALKGLPGGGAKIQYYADQMLRISRNLSDKAASPVLTVGGWRAALREFFDQIRNLFRMI